MIEAPVDMQAPQLPTDRQTGGRRLLIDLIVLFACALSAVIAFQQALKPGMLLFGDHPMHQAEVHRFIHDILPRQHWISGWSFDEFAGYPLYLYHYVLGPFLVAATSAIPGLAVESAYKFWFFASFALAGFSIYKLLVRRSRVDATSAFCLSQIVLFATPLLKFHLLGMWNFTLALGLFAWVWMALEDALLDPSHRSWARLALLTGLTPLAHPYILLSTILLYATGLCVLWRDRRMQRLRSALAVVAAGAAGALAAAIYLIPFLTSAGWGRAPSPPSIDAGTLVGRTVAFLTTFFDIVPAWPEAAAEPSAPSAWRLRFDLHVWGASAGRVFLLLLIPALIALVPFAWRNGRHFRARLALCLLGAIVFFHIQWWRSVLPFDPHGTTLQNMLEAQRFGPIAWVAGVMVIALFVELLQISCSRWRHALRVALMLGVAGAVSWNARLSQPDLATTSQTGAGYQKIREAFDFLKKNPPSNGARLAVDTLFLQPPIPLVTGDYWAIQSHIYSYIPWATGWPTFGAWCAGWLYPTAEIALSEGGQWWGAPSSEMTPEQFIKFARLLNIGKVLLREGPLASRMEAAGAILPAEWSGLGIAIHSIQGGPAGPLMSGSKSLPVELCEIGSGAAKFIFDTPQPVDSLQISIAFHPCWSARLDENTIQIGRGELALMRTGPIAAGRHTLSLVFSPPRLAPLCVSVIFLSGIIYIYYSKSRRSPVPVVS